MQNILMHKYITWRYLSILPAFAGLVCHILFLEQCIVISDAYQNFCLLNNSALIFFLFCLVFTIIALRKYMSILLPISYIFALIALSAVVPPSTCIITIEKKIRIMVHIGFAIFTYTTLIIAAIYSMQIAWINWLLKNNKIIFKQDRPSLMSIERKMLHITQIGVFLLTLAMLSGFFYFPYFFSNKNYDHAILLILDWLLYITIIWGHYQEGWRGLRIVWFNCIGAFLLMLGYFESHVLKYLHF